ncbi:MAG: ribokinase [Lysobacterales bacterium]
MAILNYGSINIDYVYQLPAIVEPGQTLASEGLSKGLGGKGANQSVAIAAAGGEVTHLGQLGKDGRWAAEELAQRGVNTRLITLADEPSGHAIIQVDRQGENAIVVHGGANQSCKPAALAAALSSSNPWSYLLLQNECNLLAEAIELARGRGLPVILNPAPMSDCAKAAPLEHVDTLVLNETEACMLSGQSNPDAALDRLQKKYPGVRLVLTLGRRGAVLWHCDERISVDAPEVAVLDTTAAGDTFVGYFVAGLAAGMSNAETLARAVFAGALAVTRSGAVASIPANEAVTQAMSD